MLHIGTVNKLDPKIKDEIEIPELTQDWYANLKKLFDDRERILNEQVQQDTTRRNMTNSLVDKLDNIFATHMAESLSIERVHRAESLAQERKDKVTKDLLFDNSHYFQMNWLYEFPEMWPAILAKEFLGSEELVTAIWADYLRKLADKTECKKEE